MNAATIPLWLALAAQLGLGLAVFRANSRSYANQSFADTLCVAGIASFCV
jgi:hypothetical protein